jgi:hypothetical protein
MLVDVPKSAILTIKNVSGSNISITPFMDFGSQYSSFLKSSLELCNSGKCIPVTEATRTTIAKDESQELVVTIALTGNLPENFSGMSLEKGLQITGEVHEDNADVEIVPQNKAAEIPLASTGVSPHLFTFIGIAGVLLIAGYGLFIVAQKKKTEEDPE